MSFFQEPRTWAKIVASNWSQEMKSPGGGVTTHLTCAPGEGGGIPALVLGPLPLLPNQHHHQPLIIPRHFGPTGSRREEAGELVTNHLPHTLSSLGCTASHDPSSYI